jgi:hypothetical protein
LHALGRKRAGTPSHSGGRLGEFERDIRGESRRNQGLRLSSILVITPAQTAEASRVLHPLRSCASECSANGRSATRSDSQRSNGRTRWDGHPAWGWKPRPRFALPSGVSANRWQGERRTAAAMPRLWVVHAWDGRLATTRRPFRFCDPHRSPPSHCRRDTPAVDPAARERAR